MKTLKYLFVAAFFLVSFSVCAQKQVQNRNYKKVNIGAGASFLFSLGDLNKFYSTGFGIDILSSYNFSEKSALTLSAGFQGFSPKSSLFKSAGFVPVLLGFKYNTPVKLYLHGQVGITNSTNKSGGSSFTYKPSFGYNFNKFIDASLSYSGWTQKGGASAGLIGIRLGVSFN